MPEALREPFESFEAVAGSIDRAKEAITAAVPGTRLSGRPLAEAILGFEEGLAEAKERMAAWRAPEVEEDWRVCDEGLAEARRRAERLRVEADAPVGFDGLVRAIGDLLQPLDAFEAAAERFLALRS